MNNIESSMSLVFLLLLCRRSTRLNHFLKQVELDSGFAFVFGQGKIVQQVEMATVGRVRVAMLIGHPLKLGGVGMARADVLGLQVLELTVDVVSFPHFFEVKTVL